MTFFWLSSFQGGFMAGLPIQHGYVVTETLVYAVLLFGLGAWGAGRLLGVDSYLEQNEFVENNEWLKYFLA
jgi:thiosulfate dehydrogenase [quinone] large subunit